MRPGWVVLIGNPLEGWDMVGPFASERAAREWAHGEAIPDDEYAIWLMSPANDD